MKTCGIVRKVDDSLLDLLADKFVEMQLIRNGWTFEQFITEYQNGYITFEQK